MKGGGGGATKGPTAGLTGGHHRSKGSLQQVSFPSEPHFSAAARKQLSCCGYCRCNPQLRIEYAVTHPRAAQHGAAARVCLHALRRQWAHTAAHGPGGVPGHAGRRDKRDASSQAGS
jgi:hypothetical protein